MIHSYYSIITTIFNKDSSYGNVLNFRDNELLKIINTKLVKLTVLLTQ